MASSTEQPARFQKAMCDERIARTDETPEPYTVFTRLEKCIIVAMVSYVSWSANLSTFIFLPALKPLSEAFTVSVDRINLIITVYMAVGAVVPLFVGDAADILGRRAAYVVTLSLFATANVCLALADSYETFLGLRILQAVGQSGVILIGYGIVSDIASPANRGSYMSAVSFLITIGPSLGPVLGGALTYAAGWAWIFWFLAIVTVSGLALIVFLLPETSRNIVGNGSKPAQPILRLPIPFTSFMKHCQVGGESEARAFHMPNPFRSLKTLLRKDNAVIVLAWGFMYAVYSALTASLSTLFIETYGLTEWQAGLIYLPFALGGTVSTFFSGYLLDTAYSQTRSTRGLSTDRIKGDDLDEFPIEKARLNIMWIPMLVITLCTVAYGWVLHYKQHIAISMVLQFMTGMALQTNFSVGNPSCRSFQHSHTV
ncbi:MFS general substrate transporter [Diaporthe amygdali]|uniref:MFS general substrate transporter n=1 Tax=Phomopsis amygdali TaxID=1214568 RepID=UPI0022FF0A1B|nr:MFS general substrate transporter [Diaporthe amygdali]KAJ0122037.1 MFS general substrate transporter [Diaporthe amygdali]